jgi:hypothetical protein
MRNKEIMLSITEEYLHKTHNYLMNKHKEFLNICETQERARSVLGLRFMKYFLYKLRFTSYDLSYIKVNESLIGKLIIRPCFKKNASHDPKSEVDNFTCCIIIYKKFNKANFESMDCSIRKRLSIILINTPIGYIIAFFIENLPMIKQHKEDCHEYEFAIFYKNMMNFMGQLAASVVQMSIELRSGNTDFLTSPCLSKFCRIKGIINKEEEFWSEFLDEW